MNLIPIDLIDTSWNPLQWSPDGLNWYTENGLYIQRDENFDMRRAIRFESNKRAEGQYDPIGDAYWYRAHRCWLEDDRIVNGPHPWEREGS